MPLQDYTLLYVEDENFTRKFMYTYFEDQFSHIYLASNAYEALEILEKNQVHVMISDIEMPDMNGLDLAQKVKELYPYIPVILLSAHENIDYLKTSIKLGADEYFTKPIEDLNALTKKVLELIEHYQLQQANKEIVNELPNIVKEHKSEILREIAHQWRQPMSAITNTFLELELKMEMDEIECQFTSEMTRIQKYLMELSSTLTTLSNVLLNNEDEAKITSESFLETIKNRLTLEYPGFNSKISLHPQSPESFIGKEQVLTELLVPIIENSIDAINDQGVENGGIELQISSNNDETILSVEDNGGGIDPKIEHKMFEPYTSTKSLNGKGLGLYIVHNTVTRLLKGSISAQNTKDGACVRIALPHS